MYFTARKLSEAFKIKNSRWKRWAREFLSPDPLGGYQSGYSRQYLFKDAFTVVLAGHLVSDLKFSVPVVKKILTDINPWLKEKGFLDPGPNPDLLSSRATKHVLKIDICMGSIGAISAFSDLQYTFLAEFGSLGNPLSDKGNPVCFSKIVFISRLYSYCVQNLLQST